MIGHDLRLFGTPVLRRGGEVAALGSRKALALLARLALGGVAAREALAPLLWPDADAAAARRNLRRELFRLRQVGVPVEESADGRLALGAGCAVDALRFRAALAEGDIAQALSWSAPAALEGLDAVAGEAFDAWLREQRSALWRERRVARQLQARQCADRGDHDGALALWLQALDEDACDEAALAAAMELHAARGDRIAALAVYGAAARALQRELGVEPSAALRQRAQALRVATPGAPTAPPAAAAVAAAAALRPTEPPVPPGLPYVARPAIEAAVLQAWQSGHRVLLHGVAGAGKTRLACTCAASGGAWIHLPCRSGDSGAPFSSAVRVLRSLGAAGSAADWPDWVRRELAQLLPELGAAPLALEGAEARERLLAAVAEALRLLLRERVRTVVLDDWQWCDADSAPLLEQLAALVPNVVVAYRTAQLPPLQLQAARKLLDDGRAVSIAVEGLDEAETLALVASLAADAAAQARRLHAATAGNPFFVIETLNLLYERSLLSGGPAADWPVPASVRDTVLGRVRAQGEAARRLLEAASLLDDPFDAVLLDGVTAAPIDEAVAVLEHAQAARLIVADGPGYRFAHELLRQCLAESLSPARRQLLHGRLAERLVERRASPSRIADQFERALRPDAAVPWRLAAGDAALRVHALAEAGAEYEAALADQPGPDQVVQAMLALARLHQRKADAAGVARVLADAMKAAARASVAWRVQARLACADERARTTGDAAAALALVDTMAGELAAVTPALRAEAARLASKLLSWQGRHDEAAAREREAIALLEAAPDALLPLGAVLDAGARRALSRGAPAEAEALAQRAVAALESADAPGQLAQALVLHGVAVLYARGDAEAARALFARARQLAAGCRHVPAQRAAILNLVKCHTDRGEADAALALVEEGIALAPGYEHGNAEQGFAQARYFVQYLRGQVDAADAAAQRLLALARPLANQQVLQMSLVMVVDLYLHTDRLEQADALLAEAEAARARGIVLLAEELAAKRAWQLWRRGDLDAAERALPALDAAFARHEGRVLVAWIGAAVALARGDAAQARARLDAAPPGDEVPVESRTLWLAQRLRCARALGVPDGEARVQARALLDARRAPVLEARWLRAALDG